jgi:hypothetical protein
MERLTTGDKSALRALSMQNLTLAYLKGFTRAPRRRDADGLFWSDVPDTALIPCIHAGRHSPPAWIKRDILAETANKKKNTYYSSKFIERGQRKVLSFSEHVRKHMKPGEETVFVKMDAENIKAWNMMPNPKFELVVVNKYDRAALLKLLAELPTDSNVERWLAERARRCGATAPTVLHADYAVWCGKHGETATGTKSFGQALVAAGVVKLDRAAGGVRYELELR